MRMQAPSGALVSLKITTEQVGKSCYAICDQPPLGTRGKSPEAALQALLEMLHLMFEGLVAQNKLDDALTGWGIPVVRPKPGKFGLIFWEEPRDQPAVEPEERANNANQSHRLIVFVP